MKKLVEMMFLIVGLHSMLLCGTDVTVTIQLDSKCKPSILFNNKVLGRKETLTLGSGDVLKFTLSGDASCIKAIAIMTDSGSAQLPTEGLKSGTIRSDADLRLMSIGLQRGFHLLVLSVAGDAQTEFTVKSADASLQKGQSIGDAAAPANNKAPQMVREGTNPIPSAISKAYHPGAMIYDAQALETPNHISEDEFLIIFNHYFRSSFGNTAQALKLVQDNPFLSRIIDSAYCYALQRSNIPKAEGAVAPSYSPLSFSSLGGLDVTNFADGLAKFLVTRTKQELAVAFFDSFKKVLSNPDYKDLRTLFPATVAALDAIGEQIYRFDAYIQTLRECFERDLRDLSTNLPAVVDNHPAYFERHKGLASTLKSACYIAQELNNKQHPGQILRDYPSAYLNGLDPNWQGAILTLQLFSESLRDTAQQSNSVSYWVSGGEVAKLESDSTQFKIYLGLIYQQALQTNVTFSEGWSLCKLLGEVAKHFTQYYGNYKSYLTNLSVKTVNVEKMIASSKKPANDSVALQQYYNYANASIDFLQSATDIGKLLPDSSGLRMSDPIKAFLCDVKGVLTPFFRVSRSGVDLVWDIKRRSYASALVDAATIYSVIISDNASKDRVGITEKSEVEHLEDTFKNLLKYGTFMATIVQAKNSDEVESAINAFALPPGSFHTKRESCFNIALNGYVGLYYGAEVIKGFDPPYKFLHANYNSYGVTAPVGIAFSTNVGGCSLSLFCSVIDVGAIASFRFKGDSTQQVPTVHLQDIVSPGLFFSVGIPGWPVSVSYGVQTTPSLHLVTASGNDYATSLSSRYSFSISVDIPIIDFYTDVSH